jgi:hypothetical protein
MDILHLMVSKAADEGLLQPLSSRSIQHRVSLYVDDVVMFLRLAAADIDLTMGILHLFGEVSGLKTNIQKSSAAPICCSATDMEVIQGCLTCRVEEFPIKYLGLPLSLKKLKKIPAAAPNRPIGRSPAGMEVKFNDKSGASDSCSVRPHNNGHLSCHGLGPPTLG